jgi:hypothetical protein
MYVSHIKDNCHQIVDFDKKTGTMLWKLVKSISFGSPGGQKKI